MAEEHKVEEMLECVVGAGEAMEENIIFSDLA